MVVGYFWKYPIVKKLANLYTTLLLISTIFTIGIYTINAVLLKSRPISSLPLSTVSCLLADTTHRFDHRTICQSHVSTPKSPTNPPDLVIQLYPFWNLSRHSPVNVDMVYVSASTNTKCALQFQTVTRGKTKGIRFQRTKFNSYAVADIS
jgi:hypothetical protein